MVMMPIKIMYHYISKLSEPPYPVIEIDRKGLAYFMNDDQGYEPGISMYGHYIACKSLDIFSEEEYMNQLTDIELICNEL